MTGRYPCICFNKFLIYKKLHIYSGCVNIKPEHYFSDNSMRRLPRQVFCFNSGNLNASYDHIHRAERFRRVHTGGYPEGISGKEQSGGKGNEYL